MLVSGVLVSSVLGLHPGEDLCFLSGLVAASFFVLEAVGSLVVKSPCVLQHFYSRKVKGPPTLEPTWARITGCLLRLRVSLIFSHWLKSHSSVRMNRISRVPNLPALLRSRMLPAPLTSCP